MTVHLVHSLITWAALASVVLLFYNAAVVIYRLLLHPLRSFPGPRIAAATYWYETYHDLFVGQFPGQGVYNIERLHKRYGKLIWYNTRSVS